MSKYIKSIIAIILLGSFILLQAETQDSGNRKIIVGGDYNFPPYEFLDKDQKPAGYNVELINAVAQEIGLKVEFRLDKWSKVKDWLETGKIDIIEGMAQSKERARTIDFSMPHCETWRSFFVQKNSGYKHA